MHIKYTLALVKWGTVAYFFVTVVHFCDIFHMNIKMLFIGIVTIYHKRLITSSLNLLLVEMENWTIFAVYYKLCPFVYTISYSFSPIDFICLDMVTMDKTLNLLFKVTGVIMFQNLLCTIFPTVLCQWLSNSFSDMVTMDKTLDWLTFCDYGSFFEVTVVLMFQN